MTQATLEQLLNRPLTQNEIDNLDVIMKMADERLMELLCVRYDCTTGKRKYISRENYKTVFTDIFNTIYSVSINGTEVTNYDVRQNDRLNATWYNSVVFSNIQNGKIIEIDADWGFLTMPADLNLLRARMFDLTFKEVGSEGLSSKSVEDFSVSFNGNSVVEGFVETNKDIISKYSNCNSNLVVSGEIYNERIYYI